LTQLQRGGNYVFIREYGAAPVEAPGMVQAERADHGPAVLVRPDGYIAWAGTSAQAPDAITNAAVGDSRARAVISR
jgi:hypothetical protein